MSVNNVPMKRIDDVTWEIPTNYKKGMRVPARLIVSEKLKKMLEMRVIEQITNVAMLPGIQKYSIALPDTHAGYGFPIGGVAAMDIEEGVISPGGIGFDINCLPGDAKILHPHGYTKEIATFEENWKDEMLLTFNQEEDIMIRTPIVNFIKRKESRLYKITTRTGYTIKATKDHPLLTREGMKVVEDLTVGDQVAIYPFEGIEYTKPPEFVIITETDILNANLGFNNERILEELKKRGLIPLTSNHPKLPLILKLFGFIIGDGSAHIVDTKEGKKASISFYGKPEDLEDIREDIYELGWTPSRIYHRKKRSNFFTNNEIKTIESDEYHIKQVSRSFVQLFYILGLPLGNRTKQEWYLPDWLKKLEKWQIRLFLAAYQGANMSIPQAMTNNRKSFYSPYIKIHRKEGFEDSGYKFMLDLKELYKKLEIETTVTKPTIQYINDEGTKSYEIKILVHANHNNLYRFFSTVGFCYSHTKSWLSNAASFYLKTKETEKTLRLKAIQEILRLHDERKSITEIVATLVPKYNINRRFIERTLYSPRKGNPRPSFDFPDFDEFIEEKVTTTNETVIFWDEIISIEEEEYNDYVYDFTIGHEAHNFVAECFVVSNCGVRMMRTSLTESEVRPKIKELVEELFRHVPAGVGVKGFVRLNHSQFEEVLENGAQWCLENGYAIEQDIKRIESNGKLPEADTSKVSDKAIKRGIPQLGTLGSGNHYLEIQVIKPGDIFDKELAKKFGLDIPNQVTLMVHCGSRGFGHQIGTDYLRTFLNVMPKYKIPIIDRELACAPIKSREGEDYYAAMSCAANMAFANRQVIFHRVREVFEKVFHRDYEDLGLELIYDVAHNIAKKEVHNIDGKKREVMVHRKGATRGFPPGHEEVPYEYQTTGQPVIIGGSMETGSYLLVGTETAMNITFGSTAHGSGRTMSRSKAKRLVRGDQLQRQLRERGIYIKGASMPGIAEEAGIAYKNIDEVVSTIEKAKISRAVVRCRPIGNIKG